MVFSMTSVSGICRKKKRFSLSEVLFVALLASLLTLIMLSSARASLPSNNLQRVAIRSNNSFTRITLSLENQPQYTVSSLPGNRLRIGLANTGGPLLKKFRRYSDSNMGGIVISRRGDNLLLTFQIAAGRGWRDVSLDGISAITLDVGKQFGAPQPLAYRPGREKIWSGVEKLVRDFDPPLKSEFPFLPTDPLILKNLLDKNGQEVFVMAEAALYKGNLAEAEEAFTQFSIQQTAIRSLALYRLGETYYKLQKYPQALAAFRDAEKLWPAYLNFNPSVTFYYGDSIARGGDLIAARSLLSRLIARLAEKKFAPVLLVRLADILSRQGHDQEALGVYRTVSENFHDNKATWMALLRLKDREFFRATPWNFRGLADVYLDVSRRCSDVDLREEAFFKYVLLESLYGEAPDALRQIVMFQKKFPRGIYAAVCRTMREVLVAQDYRQSEWSKDSAGLIRFVEEHQDYLAGCMEQPDFLPKVVKAYEESGRPIELVKLISFLLDRQWASAGAPYMYELLAENAELLGDSAMAEKSMRTFLRKFPSHPRARVMLERLGGLLYSEEKYQEVKDTLLWLLNKGEQARIAESYYYLGRSLWELKQFVPAYRSMELYLSSGASQGGKATRLLPDAYYVAASAREASGDRKGALRLVESGLKKPDLAGRDELLYKAGELNLYEGRKQLARNYFEKVVKNGKDPDWQKLARQAMESLDTKNASDTVR
jgi:TolA-binding protein